MKSLAILAALGLLFIAPVASADNADIYLDEINQMSIDPALADCFMCSSSDSKDKCKGHQQCKGTRKHCQDIGCKVTGTSSCSTAANVKICQVEESNTNMMGVAPLAADCFMCSSSDSKDTCKGHQQCKGTRKHCQKIGCKITGTSSCSTAANVKICQVDESETDMVEVAPLLADCFMCSSSDSKDTCKGHQQCKGTRKHCQKIGCKITGTSSCSTAANVKICQVDESETDMMEVAPLLADCFMCSSSDSTDTCKGHQQCKGTRKHCRKIGCKITGTSSCSTAANVKICEYDGSSLEAEEAEQAQQSASDDRSYGCVR